MPKTAMKARLFARGLRTAQGSIRYVKPVRPTAARGLVAQVYQQIESDYGFLAPPITLHSPSPEVMAASWLMMRETLLASGRADRVMKEAVAYRCEAGVADGFGFLPGRCRRGGVRPQRVHRRRRTYRTHRVGQSDGGPTGGFPVPARESASPVATAWRLDTAARRTCSISQ